MASGDKRTRKQHYIPQVYLRGFSPEYKQKDGKGKDKSKYTIHCYDLEKMRQYPQAVPIESICFEKDLYEVTNDKEEIVLPNYLETMLGSLENMFGEYRRKLEQKAFRLENLNTRCFLTKDEKDFWIAYMVIQILRMPDTLKSAEELGQEFWKGLNSNQARNFAREVCLPFFTEIKEGSREAVLVEAFSKPMQTMSVVIGVDTAGNIITGDKPIYFYSPSFSFNDIERVLFPITSKLCLYLVGGEEKKLLPKNTLFQIDAEDLEEITKSMTQAADKMIYSNHRLSKRELKQVHEVMEEKMGG